MSEKEKFEAWLNEQRANGSTVHFSVGRRFHRLSEEERCAALNGAVRAAEQAVRIQAPERSIDGHLPQTNVRDCLRARGADDAAG